MRDASGSTYIPIVVFHRKYLKLNFSDFWCFDNRCHENNENKLQTIEMLSIISKISWMARQGINMIYHI